MSKPVVQVWHESITDYDQFTKDMMASELDALRKDVKRRLANLSKYVAAIVDTDSLERNDLWFIIDQLSKLEGSRIVKHYSYSRETGREYIETVQYKSTEQLINDRVLVSKE